MWEGTESLCIHPSATLGRPRPSQSSQWPYEAGVPVVAVLQMGKRRHAATQEPMRGHRSSVVCAVSGQLIFGVPAHDSSRVVPPKPHLMFMEVQSRLYKRETET